MRALLSTLLLILPALLAGSVAGSAAAEPVDGGDPTDVAAVTMDWPTLGLEPEVFLGPDSSTKFTVPVPAGLTPARLRGVIQTPVNIDAGYVEIDDGDGTLLGVVELPPATAGQVMTPVDVDISAARVRASTIGLSLTLRATDDADQFCGPRQQLTISDLTTMFVGTEAPATTISSFFPPVLQRATIYTPADADAAEQQSVLTLVSALTRLYHPQPLNIGVVTAARGAAPPPAGQLTRAIVVEAGGPAGLSVENPGTPAAHLRVSGSGDELTTQVSLLVNQLQSLVQTAGTRIEQAGSTPALSGDTLTFAQLGISGRTDVLRTGNLRLGTDRAALGTGRVDSVQVHLLADYTPVPAADSASVVIRSDNTVVYRAPLDDTGRLDATFDLDRQAFGQWINLDLALTYTPNQVCGPFVAPITFQVDPRSTFTVRRGGPPLDGFGAVPSEFSPSFLVAFDGSSPNQLSYAARTIGAIARLTGQQLMPQVVDLRTAADATSGALIVAKSAALADTSLHPPISGVGTEVGLGLPTELRAVIDDGLGSIQVFADRPRDRSVVLVTTTDTWRLVDPLFDYLQGLDGGWSQLTGDVLAAGAAGVPINVAIRAGSASSDSVDSAAPQPSPSLNPWVPIGVGVAIVALIAVIGTAVWSRKRRSPGGALDD
ncbi:MAG: hypothetical protein WBB07_09185 [Mycobacterium sp.]